MEIEIFATKENQNLLTKEISEEWKERIKELGLKGQQDMIAVTPSESPIPYMKMKASTEAMMKVFCSERVNIEEYKEDPIPIEVLEIYKVCLEKNYFTRIEIWHDHQKPDPLMVGVVKTGEYGFDHYLIARWGAERIDWDKIYDVAFEIFKKKKLDFLKDKVETIKNNISNIDALARKHLKGEWVNWD